MAPSRLSLLRDEVRYQPSSPDAYFELGYEYFRLRNYSDAAISFKRVLLSRPQDFEALNNYGIGRSDADLRRNYGIVR